MQIQIYVVFSLEGGVSNYCFKHAAKRAVDGQDIVMEISEDPAWSCGDCRE